MFIVRTQFPSQKHVILENVFPPIRVLQRKLDCSDWLKKNQHDFPKTCFSTNQSFPKKYKMFCLVEKETNVREPSFL